MTDFRPLEPDEAAAAGLDATWCGPSGGDVHLAALWRGTTLLGAVRVERVGRLRRSHVATVALALANETHADQLLSAATALVDAHTPLERLVLTGTAGDPPLAAAAAHGFVEEVRHVDRAGDGRDVLVLGRLRPGFVRRMPGPPPPWPAPGKRAPVVSFRSVAAEDAADQQALSTEPTAVWGTLQTPWSNVRFFSDRHAATKPGNDLFAVLADGAFAGTGNLHPTALPDVLALGMAVAVPWQGCGLGGRLLDHLLAKAWRRGARRVELGVWDDNTRARALYASRGFVAEGVLRCDAIRGGGHANSLEMAVTKPA